MILDLRMPEMDGEKVLEELSRIEGFLPRVFVLTGFNDFNVTRERIQSRFGGLVVKYFDKPIDLMELGRAVTFYSQSGDSTQ